jgi:cell wall-active antibiotic response 4TMS protein YvqF
MESRVESGFRISAQLLTGLCIIGAGVLFTLDNFGVLDARVYLRYWPAALIAIGLVKVQQARGGRGLIGGTLFIVAGGWLLLDSFGLVHVSIWQLWPILLVLFGASLVWQGMCRGSGRRGPGPADANATISGVAVLGGGARGNNSRSFQGGELTAVLGGWDIDLRQAAIEGEAVIDVFALCGGIELRVPEDWTVVGRVTPVLGGFEDKTRPPQGAGTPRLIIRGLAIMGGIEVKN